MTTRSPRAARRPHQLTEHGDVRIDDYYWLRERDNPEVRAYLDAENEYLRTELSHTAALQDRPTQQFPVDTPRPRHPQCASSPSSLTAMNNGDAFR